MNQVTVNAKNKKSKISKYIYGQFAEHLGRCIYEGVYVGEESDIPNTKGMRNDVVNALKEIDIPILRWPGGCFADDYHWRDGIGPKEDRPYMVNTNWGNVVENNHFGTHEFFDLCELLETEPYICGNVGSGTIQEMRDWIEYMTFDGESPLVNERRKNGREEPWKLKFFGVGNENWGCGGCMRPEYYSDLYRRFQTFVRSYGDEKIYRIAGGPGDTNYNWTEVLMREQKDLMEGMSLHYYTIPGSWQEKGDSVDFDENQWYKTMAQAARTEEIVSKHVEIMDKYDPEKKVELIVDEWGTWFDVMPGTNPGFLYQQNTLRDVVSAMISLHIFHNHGDRITMANIAQMVNVLQSMILTEGEKMILTPTYYLFKMMKGHMDGELLDIAYDENAYDIDGIAVPKISMSASKKDDIITISMCNTKLDESEAIELELNDVKTKNVTAQILTSEDMHAHNTFEKSENIYTRPFDVEFKDGKISMELPAMSAVVLTVS